MPVKLPIQLVIDSSILRQDITFSKPDILYVKELAKLKLIKLHFPWFIYKECTSNSIDLITKELTTVTTALTGLERKGLHKTEHLIAKKIAEEIGLLKNKVESSVEKLWQEFIKETDATLHNYDASHSTEVFNDYFKGNPPFTHLKNRNDIPDAFIFQTLKSLSKTSKVHLVAGDKNLRIKCSSEMNITPYETLDEFFKSSSFKIVDDKYKEIKKIEELKPKLLTRVNDVEEGIEFFFLNYFEEADFEDRNLPSDGNEGIITGIEEIVTIEIYSDEIKFIDGYFYLSAKVSAECLVEYSIYKSDYYTLDDNRNIHISELNDHYFEAEESMPITFEFSIKIPREDIEEDKDFNIEITEYDNIYVGSTNLVQVYSVDRKSVPLKNNVTEKVIMSNPIDLKGTTFRLEYTKFIQAENSKRVTFDVYNQHGIRVSKKVILEGNGVTEFQMDYNSLLTANEFPFIELTADCDISISLSIYKDTIVFPKGFSFQSPFHDHR